MRTRCLLAVVLAVFPATALRGQAELLREEKLASPENQQVLTMLRTQVTLRFTDATLEDVASFLREVTGLNVVVDRSVREKYPPPEPRISVRLENVDLTSALRLLLNPLGLAWTLKSGVLIFVDEQTLREDVHLQVYDVRDLAFSLPDFPAPEVSLAGDGEPAGGAVIEDVGEGKGPSADFLAELVQKHTGEGSWEGNAKASIQVSGGLLFVVQSAEVHHQIESLLDKLRANR